MKLVIVIGLLLLGLGCVPRSVAPVTYVPTGTPGLMYVIVRPHLGPPTYGNVVKKDGDDPGVVATSEYFLLCDGRGTDGMHCVQVPEVAVERISHGPRLQAAPAFPDVGVGILTNTGIVIDLDASPRTPPRPAGEVKAQTQSSSQ